MRQTSDHTKQSRPNIHTYRHARTHARTHAHTHTHTLWTAPSVRRIASWKTGRSSQANGAPSRCWLCNEVGHRAVHCNKRGATQVSSSQEKRGDSGKAAGVNNVKAEPVQCNGVVIKARNQPGAYVVKARPSQDITKIRIPDSSVYRVANQMCEEIARKQANNADETDVKCVVRALDNSNAGDVATDKTETRLVNRVNFSIKGGVALSSQDAFLDKMDLANCKQPSQLSEYCNIAMF